MTTIKAPMLGYWSARVRKLQKQWDHWFPLRQHNFLHSKDNVQIQAESECERLAPLLHEAKRQYAIELNELESAFKP